MHIDRSLRPNLNSISEEDPLMPLKGLKQALKAVTRVRNERGQFTSWVDLRDQVKHNLFQKDLDLLDLDFQVVPTPEGLLRDLEQLSATVLLKRGLSYDTISAVCALRPPIRVVMDGQLSKEVAAASCGDPWEDCAYLTPDRWDEIKTTFMEQVLWSPPYLHEQGQWWSNCPDAPFPAEFEFKKSGKFLAWRLRRVGGQWSYMVHSMNPADKLFSDDERKIMIKKWEAEYQNCVKKEKGRESNGREDMTTRTYRTGAEVTRKSCFRSLLYYSDGIPVEHRKDYCVDAYGNVVCIDAPSSGSVCGFQPDHLFPWSRGGLTVKSNLAAVHWYANAHVKIDRLLAENAEGLGGASLEKRMLVGLSVKQFLAILEKRHDYKIGTKTSQARKFNRDVKDLLCSDWLLGCPELLKELRGQEPEDTYNWLCNKKAEQQTKYVVPPAEEGQAAEEEEEEDEGEETGEGEVEVDEAVQAAEGGGRRLRKASCKLAWSPCDVATILARNNELSTTVSEGPNEKGC
ncbi:hypothetical protein FOA52_000090 [Chlamydomonas sp. UWO 241]|nr:hypothetical protein FOA52_000090 [Chlamydomonas sp. UWO 241]